MNEGRGDVPIYQHQRKSKDFQKDPQHLEKTIELLIGMGKSKGPAELTW